MLAVPSEDFRLTVMVDYNTDILGTTSGRCVGVRAATEFLGKRNGRID